jgi:hypothetical protein
MVREINKLKIKKAILVKTLDYEKNSNICFFTMFHLLF